MCLFRIETADIDVGKMGRKKLEKRAKKVLTKWMVGGKIAKRLNERRPGERERRHLQGLGAQGKAEVSRNG